MEYTEELVRKAYKKLKCSIYFDKTQLLLRQQLVGYENGSVNGKTRTIDRKLRGIHRALVSDDNDKWEALQKKILKSVSFKAFPKSLADSKEQAEKGKAQKDHPQKDSPRQRQKGVSFITNSVPKETEIDKLQYFISMDVEGHILGVLWLLMIGWKLDKDLYDKSYGNRMRKLMIQELEEEDAISYSPYLFEPYFQQYESWRDSALELAQNSIHNNQDIIVFTMDFERFFYSVDLSQKAFGQILEEGVFSDELPEEEIDGDTEICAGRLNTFVRKVIEKYSRLFSGKFQGRNILPIGFLPSNVLGNWCLKRFDKAVSDGWNPLYFGRYVDDIIIVDKVERNSELYAMMNGKEVNADKVLEYCLSKCSRWSGFVSEKNCDKYALFTKDTGGEGEVRYTLNKIYNIAEDSDSHICLQNAKVKMFYFKHGESSALLQCFRNQITENKSEFRFLPEDEAVFDANDYSEIYDIDNKESINKFRGVDGISINKFALSKLLGKYMRISSLINDKVENKFAQDISQIYTPDVIIDNYITWEKVIEIFVVNAQWKALGVFMKNIFSAVKLLKCVGDGEGCEEDVRQNLQDYLYSAWVRALSLVWGSDVRKHIGIFANSFQRDLEDISEDRRQYLLTRMYDKYILPVLPDVLGKEWFENADDSEEIALYEFSTLLKESDKKESGRRGLQKAKPSINVFSGNGVPGRASSGEDSEYVFFPYMVTMYDLYIRELVVSWLSNAEKERKPYRQSKALCDMDSIKKQYIKINFRVRVNGVDQAIRASKTDLKGKKDIPVISVGLQRQGKLRIAVANIELAYSNFERLVKGNPNRSYKRYKALSHIVNSAISEKADMLVLPEAGVPIEWLPAMIRTCTKNNMALIAGIEHIIHEGRVYNYTAVVLPYEETGYRCAVLSFHLKNHYAPHELEMIHGYRLCEVSGKSYELYHWRDCWFPVYCCFELASIEDRALFSAFADVLVAVEWNKDTNYYSNILESLSRDLHCYCVQVNSSDYGDSRITMPSKTEMKDIIKTKGGNNATVLVGTVDYEKLRDFQLKEYNLQKMNKEYKPTPPLFDKEIVKLKIQGKLEGRLNR